MSSARVSRPSGRLRPAVSPSSDSHIARVPEVRVSPGATAFTRTPSGARSRASVRVIALRADLAAAYAIIVGVVLFTVPLDTFTTAPPPSANPCVSAS